MFDALALRVRTVRRTESFDIPADCLDRGPVEQLEQFYAVLKAIGCVVEMLRLREEFELNSRSGRLRLFPDLLGFRPVAAERAIERAAEMPRPGRQFTLPPELMKRAFAVPDLGGLPLYDRASPPQWFGTALSSFGIAYNRDVVAHLGLPEPKTWRDLADARYRSWIVMADPTLSSSAKAAYMTVVERSISAGSRPTSAQWRRRISSLRFTFSKPPPTLQASA